MKKHIHETSSWFSEHVSVRCMALYICVLNKYISLLRFISNHQVHFCSIQTSSTVKMVENSVIDEKRIGWQTIYSNTTAPLQKEDTYNGSTAKENESMLCQRIDHIKTSIVKKTTNDYDCDYDYGDNLMMASLQLYTLAHIHIRSHTVCHDSMNEYMRSYVYKPLLCVSLWFWFHFLSNRDFNVKCQTPNSHSTWT